MVQLNIDLENVNARELLGAFALVRIHLNGEGTEIKLTDIDDGTNPNGALEFNGTLPEIEWVFDNRSTIWKYHRSSDSVQVHASAGEQPLTKHGYVLISDGTKEYPNPSARMIYDGEDNVYKLDGGTVVQEPEDSDKKYSRVFITINQV